MKKILQLGIALALTTATFAANDALDIPQNKLMVSASCQTNFNDDIADMIENPDNYVPVISLKAAVKHRQMFVDKCDELNQHVKYLQNQLTAQKEENLQIANALMSKPAKPGTFSNIFGEVYSMAVRDIATISYKFVVSALFYVADASFNLLSRALLRN